MRPKTRWIVLALAAAAGLLLPLFAQFGASEPSAAEIARRCRESRPGWKSYQEDIKGQVGARLVAQWRGEITGVQQRQDRVTVTFDLAPPWDSREAALPVLLRLPSGEELLQRDIQMEGNRRLYHFELPGKPGTAPPPWVEVHYPHNERRIALGPGGDWRRSP